jgi:hypothetical protein
MRFAKIVFTIAGALGLLAMISMYLATESVRYYGSLGGLVAWQFAFFVIASDPRRFRPMMIPAAMEKLLWCSALLVALLQGRMTPAEVAGGTIPHLVLGMLFIAAFFKVRPQAVAVH